MSGGLSFPPRLGSTSPFVGLLGTVYGILVALIKIAVGPAVDRPGGRSRGRGADHDGARPRGAVRRSLLITCC